MKISKKKILFFSIGFISFGVGGYFLYKRFSKGVGLNIFKKKEIGALPFTSASEGNRFRSWINDNYPSYASEIDLDRTGSYNNSYMQQAWQKYGAQYKV
tara:strand:+ start:3827 stop:4123 length:297 start_codon:yes stop_codon:yes gene_type:complete